MHALVLGIGNSLLSDEGVGVHVVKYLEQQYPNLSQVSFVDGGTLSFSLAPLLENASHLIVIDAAQLQASAGTIRFFEGKEVDNFLRAHARSVHEISLRDLLDMVQLTERAPQQQALFAIKAINLGWGEFPSPEVAATIPEVAQQVLAVLKRWGVPLS
ncbi:MAG: HyaD/HybD family hydrogenase maturation endopeptidase [Thiotrichaceae bacterium]|nr:HyaD/HybD family hydrogenase maturation endopeptidase [Thiotrichaceae bacterium]